MFYGVLLSLFGGLNFVRVWFCVWSFVVDVVDVVAGDGFADLLEGDLEYHRRRGRPRRGQD